VDERPGFYEDVYTSRNILKPVAIEHKDQIEFEGHETDEEKEAYGSYQAYLNRVYLEMIRSSLIKIDGEEASLDQVQMIRPESHRVQAISELVLHIQRLSLLGDSGK